MLHSRVSVQIKAMATLTALSAVLGASVTSAHDDTATPIKHVVVIFQENVSFDHYFGTYPDAANAQGEPTFSARPGTPGVNGLTDGLLHHNPNTANPFRLDRSQNYTCDQHHDYLPEQQAADAGLMDQFVEFVGVGGPGGLTTATDRRWSWATTMATR